MEATASVSVANVPPVVTITGPELGSLYPVGTTVTFTGIFSDAGTLDTHTAWWYFDGIGIEGTVTEFGGSGSVTDPYTFNTPGVYQVYLRVYDDDLGWGSAYSLVVIYDPEGGFVTGGGWFDSPYGALKEDPTITGKATFGFVAKYPSGASEPDGNTEFQFKAGNLNFHSTSYDWLVIAGQKAMFKGRGTINDEGEYGFMLTAIDGGLPGGWRTDRIRIKIWDMETEEVIYDSNVWDDWIDAPPNIPIHGQIIIHK